MDDQDKKPIITITPNRKATEEELAAIAAIPPMKNGSMIGTWTISISHLPEMGGQARAYFPTHSCDIIKHHREFLYKDFIVKEFTNERAIKMIKTNQADLELLRKNWLQSELKEIAHFIELSSLTRNDYIELEKYRDYVNNELKKQGIAQGEPIIKTEHTGLIFERFKDHFEGETKSQWLLRFIYPSDNKILPISVSPEAMEDSNKLILIAILAAIQKLTFKNFPFSKFAQERFGISNFKKAKSDHKEKKTYIKTFKECQLILNK